MSGGDRKYALSMDEERYDTKKKCNSDSFDPCYKLSKGVTAISILDWERRQLERVASKKSLQIIHLDAKQHNVTPEAPYWYCDPTDYDYWGEEKSHCRCCWDLCTTQPDEEDYLYSEDKNEDDSEHIECAITRNEHHSEQPAAVVL